MRQLLLSFIAAAAFAQTGTIPSGFIPIFSGKDLNGWHVSRSTHHGSTPKVSVENGIIYLGEDPFGQGGLLLTDKRYKDFELYIEVKAAHGCNSGIFLRSTEGGSAYQIELDLRGGTGDLIGENMRLSEGARATDLLKVWKDGDWNSFRIRMTGDAPHVTEWVNGVRMWDVQEPRNDKIAGETDGMIALQSHWTSTYQPAGGSFPMWSGWKPGAFYQFRNIAIKDLTSTEPAYTNSIGMQFVLIHPGSMRVAVFQPACPSGGDRQAPWTLQDIQLCQEFVKRDSSPGFLVNIAKPYYIGMYEVTQAEWKKVMANDPSVFHGDRHPVDSVTWQDAEAFVGKLNQLENTGAYRLPTEFEWEYAGRAGASGQADWTDIRKQAVQDRTTQVVGSKQPNAWGLFDMLGNVWEWVQDPFNEKMFPDPVPPVSGSEHVLKGGGFVSDVKNMIYATHAAGPADGWDVGFRVVRDIP